MFLQSITLVQFRNFSRLQAELPPGLSVFAGANGSGKSNVLEAAAVLASGQSHRGADPRHMVQWGLDGLALKGEFRPSAAGEEAFTVEVKQKAGRPRQTSVNGAAQKRLRDWAGRAPLVAFSPDDLFLVKGEPALRRRALNDLLGQVDGAYLEALQRYNKVLAERNETLRQIQRGERNRSALEPWTAALLKDGAAISLARRDFLPGFSALAARKHGELAGAGEAAAILYKPSLALEAAAPSGDPDIPPGESAPARQADPASNEAAAVSAAARRRLEELREAEIAVGGTLIGPHRDDLEFLLNGRPARDYASQGQQRTLALAVKLAERQCLEDRLGRRPLFLLDDVLSELDPLRRAQLARSLDDGAQCLITLTSPADWPREAPALRPGQVFEVAAGRLRAREPSA